VSKPTLEKQLEKQAKANGAGTSSVPTSHVATSDELPYTGLGLRWIVLLGGSLVASGLALRRRSV
jgi:LPXTG-motif cell wall-anchored protein